MPRCLHPTDKIRHVLESDQHLPEREQPYFLLRALNGREFREALRICESMKAQAGAASSEVIDSLYSVLRLGICGWGNMVDRSVQPAKQITFDPASIDTVVDVGEAAELMNAILSATSLMQRIKKNSTRRTPATGSPLQILPAPAMC